MPLDTSEIAAKGGSAAAPLPPRLRDWLVGLRLLIGVPVSHLVPDLRLLPAESMRFFHVDPGWTDHLVDGALAAGTLGVADHPIAAAAGQHARREIDRALKRRVLGDAALALTDVQLDAHALPLTGMLLRSEVVRRWPGLRVEAWRNTEGTPESAWLRLPLARGPEGVAPGVLLVLFGGIPQRVHLVEPPTGMRFFADPTGLVTGSGTSVDLALAHQAEPYTQVLDTTVAASAPERTTVRARLHRRLSGETP